MMRTPSAKLEPLLVASCRSRLSERLRSVNDLRVRSMASGVIQTRKQPNTRLPQTVDLLQTYQGLITLGRIKPDAEQIRVVMQLRRLHRELEDYAPPALTAHYLESSPTVRPKTEGEIEAWWLHNPAESEAVADLKALVRVKTHAEDLANLTTPKGLLLTGPPGSGKSFLVDLWFNAIPTPYKARKHYNQLVLEIYRAVWEETQHRMANVHHRPPDSPEPAPSWNRALRDKWRELVIAGLLPEKWTRKINMAFTTGSPVSQQTIAFTVAQRLILRHWLLVFDEIQLLDVSSATLLADVLSWFWRMGGIIVGTSNKVPDDLYKNGVQRERLEPFVEAMKVRCPVVSMQAEHDWREFRAGNGVGRTWFTYDQEAAFTEIIDQMSSPSVNEAPVAKSLTIFGRTLDVPWVSGDTCRFTFTELCEESLGPADYLTVASTFRTVVITGIPVLMLSAKNEARRFISLIDALYEARCRIVCLAETEPENLFFPDAPQASSLSDQDMDVMMAEAVAETRDVYRPNISSYDAPDMSEAPAHPTAAPALETLSIFSGKDEQFAFKRALSRLRDMTSERYRLNEQWTPLPQEVRKWEKSFGGRGRRPAGATPPSEVKTRTRMLSLQPDFAEEAAYEGCGPDSSQTRPEAPRLHAEHMWGVRDDWYEHAQMQPRTRRSRKLEGVIGKS